MSLPDPTTLHAAYGGELPELLGQVLTGDVNGGKVIWAELAVPQPCEGNKQLPKRAPRQSAGHETPVTPLRDKQLMQRVLDGLYRLDSRCPHE